MKIITPGRPTPPPTYWLYERQITCPGCDCVFQVEEGDAYDSVCQLIVFEVAVVVACPNCAHRVRVDASPNDQLRDIRWRPGTPAG